MFYFQQDVIELSAKVKKQRERIAALEAERDRLRAQMEKIADVLNECIREDAPMDVYTLRDFVESAYRNAGGHA